ncbi:MAG: DNA internalization-related competence protein ComEC/Rec2 [bacterium]
MSSPLIIVTISYILGVILGKAVHLPIFSSFVFIAIGICAVFISIYLKKNAGPSLLLLFSLIGLLNFQIRNLPPAKNDISNFPRDKILAISGQIDDEPRIIEDKAFFSLKVLRVDKRKARGLLSVMTQASKLGYGDTVELQGMVEEIDDIANPGILSFADYLKNKGITCQVKSTRSPPKVLAEGGGNYFKRLSIQIKNKLIVVPQLTLPEPYSTLLSSIVFGSSAAKTPKEIKEVYKRAGVAHLLVASGMHLGILVGVCLFVVRSTRLPLGLGIFVTSLVNWTYALMTGFGPSILRAAIMAEIVLAGQLFEREKEIYTSLSLSALIILLFNPLNLFDIGFQLSFGATWAMVYISPVLQERFKPHLPRFINATVSAAMAPVLATVPITIYHFSQTSVVGILTNIILLPWVGIVVVLGFVSTISGFFCLFLGELINGANLILLFGVHQIVGFLGRLPFALAYFAPPKFPLIFAYYIFLLGGIEVLRRGRWPKMNRFRWLTVCLAIFCVIFWNAALSEASGNLAITVLDVGQGDAIFIDCPSGKKILIDGGDIEMGNKVIVPFLRKKGISELDLVVLTHPHGDHVGGLPEVLEKIKVKTVLEPGFDYNSNCYREFLKLIKQNNIKYHLARAGQVLDFGAGVKADVLYPTLPFLENCNNVSVVLHLKYGQFSMMLTGDNEREGEEIILERYSESVLASTILKVGHHGSNTSTSDHFLAAVKPKLAVISCGRNNKFRHPHQVTVNKLKANNIVLKRTDQDGAVTISSDGKSYSVYSQK